MAEIASHSVSTTQRPAKAMTSFVLRAATALVGATLMVGLPVAAFAQDKDADAKAAEAKAAGQRKIDEIAEVARQMSGPAANLECIWHGTRIVGLLWNDDIDTAERHLDMYNRVFSCPSAHIQAAFRCFLRQGPPDPKVKDPIRSLAQQCWINPGSSSAPQPSTAATSTPSASRPGTSTR
jgi:hypothetical protein